MSLLISPQCGGILMVLVKELHFVVMQVALSFSIILILLTLR